MRAAILGLWLVGCASASPSATEPFVADETQEAPVSARAPMTVMTGGFEDASAACNEWSTDAVAIRSIPARTGDYACKLCASDASGITLTRTHDLEPGTYRLRAWVRSRVGLVAAHEASISLGEATSEPVTIADDWSLLETKLDVTAGAPITAKVLSHADPTQCLLVDDVILEKL